MQLDTTLYLPATTPAPAILLAHGFGGSKADLAKRGAHAGPARVRRAGLHRPRIRPVGRADPPGRPGLRGRTTPACSSATWPRCRRSPTPRASRGSGWPASSYGGGAGAAAGRLPTSGSRRSAPTSPGTTCTHALFPNAAGDRARRVQEAVGRLPVPGGRTPAPGANPAPAAGSPPTCARPTSRQRRPGRRAPALLQLLRASSPAIGAGPHHRTDPADPGRAGRAVPAHRGRRQRAGHRGDRHAGAGRLAQRRARRRAAHRREPSAR